MSWWIGPAVSLLGSIFGSGAAQPAASAETSAAQAEANLMNTLINMWQKSYAPAEQQNLQQYMQQSQAMPTTDIAKFQVLRDLLPTYMPTILKARQQNALQNQVDQNISALRNELNARGITGPAAEALLNNMRETGVQAQAQLGSNIGEWEAQQTLAGQRNAFQDVEGLLGGAFQATEAGRSMPGIASTGTMDLAKLFGSAAQGAAAPWQQMSQNIAGSLANQQYLDQLRSMLQPAASTGGGSATPSMPPYGGGAGTVMPSDPGTAQYF